MHSTNGDELSSLCFPDQWMQNALFFRKSEMGIAARLSPMFSQESAVSFIEVLLPDPPDGTLMEANERSDVL